MNVGVIPVYTQEMKRRGEQRLQWVTEDDFYLEYIRLVAVKMFRDTPFPVQEVLLSAYTGNMLVLAFHDDERPGVAFGIVHWDGKAERWTFEDLYVYTPQETLASA
jgi:hypothetical protein